MALEYHKLASNSNNAFGKINHLVKNFDWRNKEGRTVKKSHAKVK
jgi:hypothetical protein